MGATTNGLPPPALDPNIPEIINLRPNSQVKAAILSFGLVLCPLFFSAVVWLYQELRRQPRDADGRDLLITRRIQSRPATTSFCFFSFLPRKEHRKKKLGEREREVESNVVVVSTGPIQRTSENSLKQHWRPAFSSDRLAYQLRLYYD